MEEETVIKVEVDELIIEPINGKVIDLENSDLSVGKIVFKKKENELPTKWEDLDTSIIKSDLCGDFPTMKEIKANNALRKLCYLRDAYNGEPLADWCDWSDANTKYCICFYEDKICKTKNRGDEKILSFKTDKLRDKFVKNFEDLILTAKPLF
jgi:hypothetical protein